MEHDTLVESEDKKFWRFPDPSFEMLRLDIVRMCETRDWDIFQTIEQREYESYVLLVDMIYDVSHTPATPLWNLMWTWQELDPI